MFSKSFVLLIHIIFQYQLFSVVILVTESSLHKLLFKSLGIYVFKMFSKLHLFNLKNSKIVK